MTRITMQNLTAIVDRLNRDLNRPREYMTAGRINRGHFHIYQAYGRYQVVETVTDGGGIRTYSGLVSKREAYDYIGAMLDGIRLGERTPENADGIRELTA